MNNSRHLDTSKSDIIIIMILIEVVYKTFNNKITSAVIYQTPALKSTLSVQNLNE